MADKLKHEDNPTGVSNREAAEEEERARRIHPPLKSGSPQPEDAAGRVGEQPLADSRDRHTSHKAGSRSVAQKEAESKYSDRPMPASRKVAGAYGQEPDSPSPRDYAGSAKPNGGRRTK